ncbi:uncharacterized protein LOC131649770 [Vicia villosa]|uniref:uncharacterized protein LOC131649770 n=1 Tax=Vicia villosa TaxID=3911 RepID=UPI00273AAB23|nr:uncharacterized protein LOC131649770 [Vicia villosa]
MTREKGILKARLSFDDCRNSWQQMMMADKFKMEIFYKELMQNYNNVDWYVVFAGNIARPRALFFLWLAFHRRLATKDRLAKFGIIRETQYCFCSEVETIDHLFYSCNVMKFIWSDILKWINVDHVPLEWNQEICWLIQIAKGKGMKVNLLKMAAAETLYCCWKFRNDTCFGNPQIVDKVVHNIQEAIIHRGWNYRKYRDLIAKLLM